MKERIISGIVGFLLLVGVIILGKPLLNISILFISLIGLYEFYKAAEKIDNIKPIKLIGYIFAVCIFAITFIENSNHLQLILFLYILSLLCIMVIKDKETPGNIGVTILGGLYIPFFIFHIVYLAETKLIWLVFIIAFATDTFAYFIGIKFGRKKIFPKLSPKKSLEGSLAGIVGSLIVVFLYVRYFSLGNEVKLSILAVIGSIMAQIGDLTASKFKRIANIKDYGNIMPGHGGVLDRFDSILFTAPIVYYYIKYVL